MLHINFHFTHTHLDVVCHDGDVLKVQGCINLIHDVERGGLVVVEGEHQG